MCYGLDSTALSATSSMVDPAFEAQVLSIVNNIRIMGSMCGTRQMPPVPALVLNNSLANAARNHSIDMSLRNYFSHTSLDGRTFVDRILRARYSSYYALGENIAAGYMTPAAVVNAWMESYGHCINIMSSSFRHIGVGYAFNPLSTYDYYWTQNFGNSP